MICRWFRKLFKNKQPRRVANYDNSLEWDQFELEVLDALNDYRVKHGQTVLVGSRDLQRMADRRADECKRDGKISHDGYNRVAQLLAPLGILGLRENLAYGYEYSEQVIKAWSNSPSHNRSMLMHNSKYAGIGHTRNGKRSYICLLLAR